MAEKIYNVDHIDYGDASIELDDFSEIGSYWVLENCVEKGASPEVSNDLFIEEK